PYMTDPKSFHLSRKPNDNSQRAISDDKLQFAERFAAELGRAWLVVSSSAATALAGFLRRYDRTLTKKPRRVDGHGHSLRATSPIPAVAALREELVSAGQTLVEEVLVQHPEMARLYPGSVNSLRMVTYLDPDGEVHLLAGVLKIGN